jgi:two-component system sensor histidine kinase HydH
MERGGVLSIMSTNGGNEHIKVEISDIGSGISPRDLKRVFDPFFTTKPGGTGLGLAIVHKMVEAHKREVKVESLSGRGICLQHSLTCPMKTIGVVM